MGAFIAFMAFASLPLLFLSFPSAPPPLLLLLPAISRRSFCTWKYQNGGRNAHRNMQGMCKKCQIYKFPLSVQLTHKQVFIEKTKISDWQQVFTFYSCFSKPVKLNSRSITGTLTARYSTQNSISSFSLVSRCQLGGTQEPQSMWWLQNVPIEVSSVTRALWFLCESTSSNTAASLSWAICCSLR